MKRKIWVKGLSLMICLMMVLSMLPLSALALDAIAVEVIEVSGLDVPYAGQYAQPIDLNALSVSSGVSLAAASSVDMTAPWKDAYGRVINNPRYKLEAGKTYMLTVQFASVNPDLYCFNANTKVKLAGVSASEYTVRIDGYIGKLLTATISFKIPGTQEYADITEIFLQDVISPQMGEKPNTSVSALYDNYTIGTAYWIGGLNNGTFKENQTYQFHIQLLASVGYQFAREDALSVSLDSKQPDSVSYGKSGDVNTLDLEFSYQSSSKREIGTVRLEGGIFVPRAGEPAVAPNLSDLRVSPTAQYTVTDTSGIWKTENSVAMPSAERFRYGRAYNLTVKFTLKEAEYNLFTEKPALVVENLKSHPHKVTLLSRTPSTVVYMVSITAQFPDGAGVTQDKPADCYCYQDLQGALSSTAIRYVRLHNVSNNAGGKLPLPVKGDYLHYSILSVGTKYLELAGDAVFGYDWTYLPGYCKPSGLIYNTGNLTICGDGSLTYLSPAVDSYNAAIVNRQNLTIESGTITGYDELLRQYDTSGNNKANTYFGCAVYQNTANASAKLTINGGTLKTHRYVKDARGQAAVFIDGGSATINGGTFTYDVRYGLEDQECDALNIKTAAKVTIHGGSFKNMTFEQNVALSKYVPSTSRITLDGNTIANTLTAADLTGLVEIYRTISKLDLHINSPSAGQTPSREVYVTNGGAHLYSGSASVSWYDRTTGRTMTENETFQAQHIYAVTIRMAADDHMEFMTNSSDAPTTPTTLNFKTVALKKISGESGKRVMEFTYVFGNCPAVIDHVDITMVPPAPGRIAGSGASFDSDVYGQYPTDPVSWYDVTLGKSLNTGDTFVKGHQYRIGIWVKAANNYEFAVDGDMDPAITANVNGSPAVVYRAYEQSADEVVEVAFDFGICGENTIDFINVFNLDTPQPGAKPDMEAVVQEPGKYELKQIQWKGPSGAMSAADTFQPGKTYTVTLQVASVKLGGNAMYPFDQELQCYINGSRLSDEDVTVYSDFVYLTQSWVCPTTSEDTGLLGDVTGDGKVNMADVAKAFAHVRNKSKLTDAGALLRADATGDGKINMADVARIFAHVRGKNPLF